MGGGEEDFSLRHFVLCKNWSVHRLLFSGTERAFQWDRTWQYRSKVWTFSITKPVLFRRSRLWSFQHPRNWTPLAPPPPSPRFPIVILLKMVVTCGIISPEPTVLVQRRLQRTRTSLSELKLRVLVIKCSIILFYSIMCLIILYY